MKSTRDEVLAALITVYKNRGVRNGYREIHILLGR